MAGFNLFKKVLASIPIKRYYKRTTAFIKKKPLGSFFIALGLLLLLIIVGRILNTPKEQKAVPPLPKSVQLYGIGTAPKVTVQAKIEKAGVVKIVAQTAGIVQEVNVTDGDKVGKGQQLITLSTNYQGGNAPAVQAQIAQTQYQNVLDTFSQQQDAINKQKDIANITLDNFNDQQSIATQSANQTTDLINANQSVLDSLNQQLQTNQNNPNPSPPVTTQESTINQLQSAQNQLKQQLLNLQQQTDSNKPPGRLANAQHDLTLQQLTIQEKSLELNKEVTSLQSEMAQVNADMMLPASPVKGVVQRVFVHVGEQVSQGTELAVISASTDSSQTIAIADVPQQIAQNVSRLETSNVYLNGNAYHIKPFYVSSDATNGLLYSIFYVIPADDSYLVTDGQYVNVDIPVGQPNTGSTVPFVPIDAVYQTQDSNYLLVDKNGKAESRTVTLGNVFGSYIEVTNGLTSGDQVILDRNVIAGDKVKIN
ncbi:MAG TPA: biotin/lipoyl-binding protein [Candidatus Acidoferrales bacterium]|nr:biotin/lipoyl-binding protein [Candidatus Acidoferrales bacterium]